MWGFFLTFIYSKLFNEPVLEDKSKKENYTKTKDIKWLINTNPYKSKQYIRPRFFKHIILSPIEIAILRGFLK